jgi:hypothetical protein
MLTQPGQLGPETGEIYPFFDDVDDYNNLSVIDSTIIPNVPLTVNCSVTYIDQYNPGQSINNKSYVKKLRVTVSSPYLTVPGGTTAAPIYFEQLYGYH